MKRSGIYIIENRYNGKVYVGSTVDLDHRYFSHFSHLRAGNHPNYKLQAAFNQDGEAAFSYQIIETCDPSELTTRETHWISQLQGVTAGYNLSVHAIRPSAPNAPAKFTMSLRLTTTTHYYLGELAAHWGLNLGETVDRLIAIEAQRLEIEQVKSRV